MCARQSTHVAAGVLSYPTLPLATNSLALSLPNLSLPPQEENKKMKKQETGATKRSGKKGCLSVLVETVALCRLEFRMGERRVE